MAAGPVFDRPGYQITLGLCLIPQTKQMLIYTECIPCGKLNIPCGKLNLPCGKLNYPAVKSDCNKICTEEETVRCVSLLWPLEVSITAHIRGRRGCEKHGHNAVTSTSSDSV